ncbi:MAG TPA: PAS domain S-box protein [Polyangiales bacterium]|nr:PAS domain S-box protein [Polyangiales bacterium]
MGEGPSLFESAFRDAAIGMALVSLEGHWLKVNDAVCSLLGYSRQSLLETDFQALTHPDDLAQDLALVHQLIEDTIPSYRLEKRYLHAAGHVVRAQLTVSLVRDEAGAPQFFISQIQDVTARREAEEEAALFFEGSLDMLAMANAAGALERVNRAWERTLGWTAQELTAHSFIEFVHAEDKPSVELQLAAIANGQAAQGVRCRVRCKDGGHRWLEWTVRPIEGRRALCTARDVTTQVEQEQSLRLSQRALASVSDGVLITDPTRPDNPIVYCNASFERITGYRESELVGRSCRVLQGDDRDQPELESLREALREERAGHAVLRNYRKDGELFLNSLSITPVRNAAGQVTNYVGSVEDITERVHMEDQIRRAALTDELTGLYNRRGFLLLAEQQLRLAARHRQAVGLLFVDVDGMKRINDELGHDSGDDALIDVATILHRVLRSSDVVARLGGDEFVALVEGDADDVDVLRARLLETLARHNQIANRAYRIALSVGSSICVPDRPVSLNDLIARADEAMYTIKRRRRSAHAN